MRQTTDELYKELTDRLKHVIKDIGYDLPPDKIPDTTKSLINLFITYEKYKDSITSKVSKELERGIKRLPIEKQKELERKVNEYYER